MKLFGITTKGEVALAELLKVKEERDLSKGTNSYERRCCVIKRIGQTSQSSQKTSLFRPRNLASLTR